MLNIKTERERILHSKISDHFPIIFEFNNVPSVTEPNLNGSHHQVIDYTLLIQSLSATKWNLFIIVRNLMMHVRLSIKKINHKYYKWITLEIIHLMQTRDKLYKTYINDVTNVILERKYKDCRNKVINIFLFFIIRFIC